MRVIDTDPHSVRTCLAKGVDAALDDALAPHLRGDEDVVCFKLIQHHLVGPDEAATLALQRQALAAWRPRARAVFVNEYIYDSHFATLSGRLIYEITSNRALSALASVLNRVVPSLRANTGPAWACWPWYGANGADRLEAACTRVMAIRAPNLRSVANILKCGLDRQPWL